MRRAFEESEIKKNSETEWLIVIGILCMLFPEFRVLSIRKGRLSKVLSSSFAPRKAKKISLIDFEAAAYLSYDQQVIGYSMTVSLSYYSLCHITMLWNIFFTEVYYIEMWLRWWSLYRECMYLYIWYFICWNIFKQQQILNRIGIQIEYEIHESKVLEII